MASLDDLKACGRTYGRRCFFRANILHKLSRENKVGLISEETCIEWLCCRAALSGSSQEVILMLISYQWALHKATSRVSLEVLVGMAPRVAGLQNKLCKRYYILFNIWPVPSLSWPPTEIDIAQDNRGRLQHTSSFACALVLEPEAWNFCLFIAPWACMPRETGFSRLVLNQSVPKCPQGLAIQLSS